MGIIKDHNRKERNGLRKARKDNMVILSSLRTLRKAFAIFAVIGFCLFLHP